MHKAFLCGSVLFAVLFMMQPVQAQRKVTAPAGIWPELQVSYSTGEAGVFFFQNQYRINTDSRFNDFRKSGIFSNFERIQIAAGYEQAFTDHWRVGALWRYAAEDYPSTSFYALFLRHAGAVKGLFFNKQLLVEYVVQQDQEATGRTYLMGEAGKRFQVKQHIVSPSISYEAAVFTRFGEEATTTKQRFIDRARLRLNLTYEASPKLHITPYFLRQSDYYYVEVPPVYDEDDVLVTNGYRTKRNRITPVIGLEIKYHINRPLSPASFAY